MTKSSAARRAVAPAPLLFLAAPLAVDALRLQRLDLLLAFNVLMSLAWLGLLAAWAQRPARWLLALAPLYLAAAADLFIALQFENRLTSAYIGIALTNAHESADFASTYAKPIAAVAAAAALACGLGLWGWAGVQRTRRPRLALLCAALLAAGYAGALARSHRAGMDWPQSLRDVAVKDATVPLAPLVQAALAVDIHLANRAAREARSRDRLGARQAQERAADAVYVLVVGESSRAPNWSLFGYARDTTPRLAQQRGLVPLPDMLATAPYTSVAVPSLLSLASISDWNSILAQRSIVSAFAEAGFDTWWLSTQEADGWGGVIPQIAAEAAHQRYLDREFDAGLLAPLRAALEAAPRPRRLFVVLHTDGSHFDYARRYPPSHAVYDAAAGDARARVVAAYDNSVRYTDAVLADAIALLQELAPYSALFYASDHGENLLDDARALLGHSVGTRLDLHSAAFVWLSDALRAALPGPAARLQAHAGAALSLSNLPHSLLDLAGIEARGLDTGQSLFSAGFTPRPRLWRLFDAVRTEAQFQETP